MVIWFIVAVLGGALGGYTLRNFVEGPVIEGLKGEIEYAHEQIEYAHEQLEAYEDRIADLMEKVAKKARKTKTEVAAVT